MSCRACRLLLDQAASLVPAASVTVQLPGDLASVRPAGPPRAFGADLAHRVARSLAAGRLGTVLHGKWRVDRLLGIGGMAQVFAGTHRNGHRVALKLMRPEMAAVPELVERFLREGYLANKVEHPGAVAILDDDLTDDGIPFLVMQLLDGQTLRTKLDERGSLSLRDAIRVTEQVLDVLAAAHDKGIVHRDIKPENLFETTAGAIKVLDFGIARLRDEASGPHFTQSGVTMGTVGYMPPEQARGQTAHIDARTDVWAVGATLFTLLTGRLVHRASTANETLLLAMTQPVAPMRELLPGLPPEVADVLDVSLAFRKEDRFEGGKAMRAAVQRVAVPTYENEHVAPATLLGMARTVALRASEVPAMAASVAPVESDPRAGALRRRMALAGVALLLLCLGVAVPIGIGLLRAGPSGRALVSAPARPAAAGDPHALLGEVEPASAEPRRSGPTTTPTGPTTTPAGPTTTATTVNADRRDGAAPSLESRAMPPRSAAAWSVRGRATAPVATNEAPTKQVDVAGARDPLQSRF